MELDFKIEFRFIEKLFQIMCKKNLSPVLRKKEIFQRDLKLNLPNTHSSHEINLMMTTFYQIIGVVIVVGCDSFFIVLTFHCVAKMDVCCSEASKIDGRTDKKFISNLVEKHFRVLEIIRISEEVLNPIYFHQLVSTFGVLVCTGFNIKAKADYLSSILLILSLFQFYFYCFLGNYVSSMCEKFQSSIYCSKWYEIKDISTKKKILFMMMMAQRRKGFSILRIKPLNLETYADVMKQAYTFLNILLGVL
ncbi:CLUMA_CG003977, isoform A [Clunio marinus]|uniref:CLUMA_CG003977, isoform A n=1 Tax=Clunio marinus TaxID=568069 RepID=A0A1J1HRW3_9DIPT|nr:CLUMA_CG003977, isoform A [Clunio marinus]